VWSRILLNCVERECSVWCPRRHCPIACCQPNLSIGELDLHFGTITCAGGDHSRYRCRSIDTDYQSNCIIFTVFINTNVFVMRALSAHNQSAMYGTENVVTSGSLAFPVSSVLLLARSEVCHQVYREPSLAWLLGHLSPPPQKKTGVLLVCCDRNCKSWLLQVLEWQKPALALS
jgi:hypothetical protein